MKTLVIGLGNPLLGDDGVGWRVAEQVQRHLQTSPERYPDVQVDFLSVGGLSLMEHLIGCQRAILVDALSTGAHPAGALICCPLAKLPDLTSEHMTNAHDTSLQTALQVGRQMGAELPYEIIVVGIEANKLYDFTDELTPAVAEAAPKAVQTVLELLTKPEK